MKNTHDFHKYCNDQKMKDQSQHNTSLQKIEVITDNWTVRTKKDRRHERWLLKARIHNWRHERSLFCQGEKEGGTEGDFHPCLHQLLTQRWSKCMKRHGFQVYEEAWVPTKLLIVGSSSCHGQQWSYIVLSDGVATGVVDHRLQQRNHLVISFSY